MSEDVQAVLERMREFERTFEQNYGRKMNDEEQRILEAARKFIQEKSAEPLKKLVTALPCVARAGRACSF